jgi:hypothetical protein
MSPVTSKDFLIDNPHLDPRDLYNDPQNPAMGVNLDNAVICQVGLVVVDYATGNVIEEVSPIKRWNGPFNRVETIEISEEDINQIKALHPGPLDMLSGGTTLRIDATGNNITFKFDRMMPTWAFRISFYTQANQAGTVNNITELNYEFEGKVLPEDGPTRSDEPTTIR